MTIQISILGLGQIGASIGLALQKHKDTIVRMGHDKESQVAKGAKRIGAVDKTSVNLFRAVEGADAVILALPLDQIRDTLALIGNDLEEDVVVMDTGPVKGVVASWAEEFLPQGRHYIGLTPVINPAYLNDSVSGLEAAHEDLFERGLMAIVPPPGANGDAVKFAVDLTTLLRATPIFVDLLEVDSFMAATHLLPQLLAAALVGATTSQPGWQDGGKFAGRAYAQVTSPVNLLDTPAALAAACQGNSANVDRVLDNLIAGLLDLKESMSAQPQADLEGQLGRMNAARQRWMSFRQAANWDDSKPADLPTISQTLSHMVLGRGQRDKKKGA